MSKLTDFLNSITPLSYAMPDIGALTVAPAGKSGPLVNAEGVRGQWFFPPSILEWELVDIKAYDWHGRLLWTCGNAKTSDVAVQLEPAWGPEGFQPRQS